MLNVTNIPAPRVPITDAESGIMSREWYRFFFNLFNLTGAGSNPTSLSDLQVGPPPSQEINFSLQFDEGKLGPPVQDQSGTIEAAATQAVLASMVPDQSGAVQAAVDQGILASMVADQSGAVQAAVNEGILASMVADQSGAVQAAVNQGILAAMVAQDPPLSRRWVQPTAITLGASPYTFQNTTGESVDVIVSGGGVKKLQFTRNGSTLYDSGSFYGLFQLSPYDQLKITYATSPTVTLIPR